MKRPSTALPPELTLSRLTTERQNTASRELDTLAGEDIARLINAEDSKVAAAVRRALPEIGEAIEAIAAALLKDGRLIYVGAGTSGRLAVLDAAECPPTFGVDPRLVQ